MLILDHPHPPLDLSASPVEGTDSWIPTGRSKKTHLFPFVTPSPKYIATAITQPRRHWLSERLWWNPIGPSLQTGVFGDAHKRRHNLNTEQLGSASMWWTVIALSTPQDPKGVRTYRLSSYLWLNRQPLQPKWKLWDLPARWRAAKSEGKMLSAASPTRAWPSPNARSRC